MTNIEYMVVIGVTFASLLIGGLLGGAFSTPSRRRHKAEVASLTKENERLEKEAHDAFVYGRKTETALVKTNTSKALFERELQDVREKLDRARSQLATRDTKINSQNKTVNRISSERDEAVELLGGLNVYHYERKNKNKNKKTRQVSNVSTGTDHALKIEAWQERNSAD